MTRLSIPARPRRVLGASRNGRSVQRVAEHDSSISAMTATTQRLLDWLQAELQQAQRRVSVLGDGAPEDLESQLSELAAAFKEARSAVVEPPNYTVALMGRTQAGKSTLMAALTGASEEAIGWPGRQRHTRDVSAAVMSDLPGIELIDTPGVGALDGPEDRELALAQLDKAQIVLWVAPNDGFQEDTAESLRFVASLGKPVVVVLNSKADLRHPISMEDFLQDPERMLDESIGHLEAIRRNLREVGAEPLAEIVLHAQAGFFARQESRYAPTLTDATRARLGSASRIDKLIEILDEQAQSDARKVLAVAHTGRVALSSAAALLRAGSAQLEQASNLMAEKSDEVSKRQERAVAACEDRALAKVRELVSGRRAWVEDLTLKQLRDEVDSLWLQQQEALNKEVSAALGDEFEHLQEELHSAVDDVNSEYEHLHVTFDRPDVKEKWFKRAVKLAANLSVHSGGAAVGAKIGAWIGGAAGSIALPGIGTVTGASLGTGLGAVVGGFAATPLVRLANRVADIFRSEAEILQRHRKEVRDETDQFLDQQLDSYLQQVGTRIAEIRSHLSEGQVVRQQALEATRTTSGHLAAAADRVESTTAGFDADTAVHTLGSAGVAVDRAAVLDAWRSPGHGTVVRVREPLFTELALGFNSTPEPITPISESVHCPAADTTQVLLGVTDAAMVVSGHPDHVHARIDGTVPSLARREAWEELSQRMTGTRVTIAAEYISAEWRGKEKDSDAHSTAAA